MTIKELVKDNEVTFDSFRQGFFYYNLEVVVQQDGMFTLKTYQFSVPLEDIGTATMPAKEKALLFMRWIRKAVEDKTLIEI